MSHWKYQEEIITELPSGVVGFVYRITNTTNGRMYIGRKYIESITRKPLTKKQKEAGRVRKEVVRKESNWRDYTGSNKPLNEDIKKLGKDQFDFRIIAFGETRGQTNFLEEIAQIKLDALVDSNYYNDSVGSRRFISVKINDFLKEQIKGIK